MERTRSEGPSAGRPSADNRNSSSSKAPSREASRGPELRGGRPRGLTENSLTDMNSRDRGCREFTAVECHLGEHGARARTWISALPAGLNTPTPLKAPMVGKLLTPPPLSSAQPSDPNELLQRIDQRTAQMFHWIRAGLVVIILLLIVAVIVG